MPSRALAIGAWCFQRAARLLGARDPENMEVGRLNEVQENKKKGQTKSVGRFQWDCKNLLQVILTPPGRYRYQHPHDTSNPPVGRWGNCEPKWWPQGARKSTKMSSTASSRGRSRVTCFPRIRRSCQTPVHPRQRYHSLQSRCMHQVQQ
jgi:hypothetical protein